MRIPPTSGTVWMDVLPVRQSPRRNGDGLLPCERLSAQLVRALDDESLSCLCLGEGEEMIKCETPDACRIARSGGVTTAMYFQPVYDGHGNNLNPDMNFTSYTMSCSTCGKTWSETWQGGKKVES